MSYNIEDEETFLKNESPYQMSDDQWKVMQQRIKSNVLAATAETSSAPVKKMNYWKITAAAAIVCIIIAAAIFFISPVGKQINKPANNLASTHQTIKKMDPEMQLDDAISHLNEAELNLSHQINENEISEQNEYLEN